MSHSAFWYFERFRLLQGLSDGQKRQVERQARMLHMKRGEPIYLPALDGGVLTLQSQDDALGQHRHSCLER